MRVDAGFSSILWRLGGFCGIILLKGHFIESCGESEVENALKNSRSG